MYIDIFDKETRMVYIENSDLCIASRSIVAYANDCIHF